MKLFSMFEGITSTHNYVQWFVSEMGTVLDRAADAAEKDWNNNEDKKSMKLRYKSIIGKWYSQYVISSGFSLNAMVHSLKSPYIKLPMVISNRAVKAEMEYSNSANLLNLIDDMVNHLPKLGYVRERDVLRAHREKFIKRIQSLEHEADKPAPVAKPIKNTNIPQQNQQAQSIISTVIGQLPKSVQHQVRTELQRTGGTLADLKAILNRLNIQM